MKFIYSSKEITKLIQHYGASEWPELEAIAGSTVQAYFVCKPRWGKQPEFYVELEVKSKK